LDTLDTFSISQQHVQKNSVAPVDKLKAFPTVSLPLVPVAMYPAVMSAWINGGTQSMTLSKQYNNYIQTMKYYFHITSVLYTRHLTTLQLLIRQCQQKLVQRKLPKIKSIRFRHS